MDQQLQEFLEGREKNYLLPFLWMQDGKTEDLSRQVETVWKSGARAFCVESRTHHDFGGPGWWKDMEIILEEAQKRNMQVWILDDRHFPTGYANGLVPRKYPERRKWHLIEYHTDAIGPMAQAAFLEPKHHEEDRLIGAFLCKRSGAAEELCGEPIDVTNKLRDGVLLADIPEGCWRAFFVYQSREGAPGRQAEYIHLIDKESVSTLIEAVYEPHYVHFSKYFGNTLAGFFSDEPSLGNDFFDHSAPDPGMKYKTLGIPGLALPWSEELAEKLNRRCGKKAAPYLPALWYGWGDMSRELRFSYMDILTALYRDAFCRQLGDWCRAHNVRYIGHIIEDMNAHARLSCSAGHYFRSLDGQDMSGMDIVLHQVMPGFADYQSSASCAGGVVDPEFYHYSLAQMCASMAQLNPRMNGCAMCEVFGAYGWAEGAPMMKWLIDHLLVRGINHFVPHAFSPQYPNPDCPPHFGADGNDPQFDGFTRLMRYTNQVSHLLCGAKSTARVAVLYHGEAEWASGMTGSMLMQKPGKILTDAHIAFEYLPLDYIREFGEIKDGLLSVNDVTFRILLVPYAEYFPENMRRELLRLASDGIAVFLVCEKQDRTNLFLPQVRLEALADTLASIGFSEIILPPEARLVRAGHWKRGATDFYFFFNEGTCPADSMNIQIPSRGNALSLDLMGEIITCISVPDGLLQLSLAPGESRIFVFGDELPEFPAAKKLRFGQLLHCKWDISLRRSGLEDEFRPLQTAEELPNITALEPDFSGVIRYRGRFMREGCPASLDLGQVGETARLRLNGIDLGIRLVPPYRFDLSSTLRQGENFIEIEVCNTLAHRLRDPFSRYIALPPSGMLGPVRFLEAAPEEL